MKWLPAIIYLLSFPAAIAVYNLTGSQTTWLEPEGGTSDMWSVLTWFGCMILAVFISWLTNPEQDL